MSKSNKDKAKIAKIVNILSGNKTKQIANVINKVSIKDFEQIREIVPIEKWISDPYYCGKDCVDKLYPFWKELICDILLSMIKFFCLILSEYEIHSNSVIEGLLLLVTGMASLVAQW